jgi:hypothetical protein
LAKFSQLAKGRAARCKGVAFSALDCTECVVDLAIVTGDDDDDILEAAAKHAVSKEADAVRGNPVYDFACDVELVFRACLDPDSPEDKPERFFESAADVRKHLDRDRIAYLAARQHEHQERLSPLRHEMSAAEYTKKIFEIVASSEGDDGPFRDIAQSLLRSFTRRLVSQNVYLQTCKSDSGGDAFAKGSEPKTTRRELGNSSLDSAAASSDR